MPGHASSNANVPDMLPATSRLDDHAVSRTSSLPPLMTRLSSPRSSRTPPATVPLTAMAVASHASEAMRMTTKLVKVVVYATFALLIGLGAGYSIFNRGKHNVQLGVHYTPAFTDPGTVHNFGFTFGYQFQ